LNALVFGIFSSEALVVPQGSALKDPTAMGPALLLSFFVETQGRRLGVDGTRLGVILRDAATGHVVLNQRIQPPNGTLLSTHGEISAREVDNLRDEYLVGRYEHSNDDDAETDSRTDDSGGLVNTQWWATIQG